MFKKIFRDSNNRTFYIDQNIHLKKSWEGFSCIYNKNEKLFTYVSELMPSYIVKIGSNPMKNELIKGCCHYMKDLFLREISIIFIILINHTWAKKMMFLTGINIDKYHV